MALAVELAARYYEPAATVRAARGRRGIAATITTQAWKNVIVELIEVGDEGLLVDSAQGVALVRSSSSRAWLRADRNPYRGRPPPAAKAREKLRLLSRFPQGLSPSC